MKIPKSYLNNKVVFKKSRLHGKGMFAKKLIKMNEKVLIWGGIWNVDYTNKKGLITAVKNGKHVTKWDTDLYCIEYDGEDPNYFINHSCEPNTWLVNIFTLIARKNIQKGSEITVNYSTFETSNFYSDLVCNCGSKNCAGSVTGKKWKNKKFQKIYNGHTTPYISKLIKSHD